MAGRRRSTRLSSQTDAGEESNGVARRRSPRLHPQTHASEDGAGTIRRIRSHRGSLPEAPASLPDIDDVLWEILLHLPRQPSSLPRASAVCKQWQRVATDPQFIRSFHAHHRLLGAFVCSDHEVVFTPSNLDPPGRTRPERFCLGRYGLGDRRYDIYFLGYRHGRALLKGMLQKEFVVCDLVTGERRCVALPPNLSLNRGCINGAVLCAAGDQGHVHDGCHSGPFKLLMVSTGRDDDRSLACVYYSQSGIWGDASSTKPSCPNCHACSRSSPSTLVGNVVYWVLSPINHGILEFDLNTQSLALIKAPWCADDSHTHQIIQAEDGIVGLAAFSYSSFQMWQREVDMHNILRLPSQIELAWREMVILGYDEVNGVIFLYADRNAYMVEVKSMQPKKLTGTHYMNKYHPFTSFYIPGGGPAAAVFTEFVALDQCGLKYFYVV